MIINSITLKNFKSYEEETTFSFSPSKNKNIVLIGGENGAGKSALFEAIKICIYGSTTYGYMGKHYNYLSRIKSNINNNAFRNENIQCFIGLNLSITQKTNINSYYLKRSWTYENYKLIENFNVTLNGKTLNENELLYFDKYMKSILPPSLFDFFFFDGEELSNFFIGKNSNNNLKDAILELFNYDTFDILKTHLISQQRTHLKGNQKLSEAQNNFDKLNESILRIKNEIKELEDSINYNENKLDTLVIEKKLLEKDFRNNGGLTESEKALLYSEIAQIENERNEINYQIKTFCNDKLPFLLVTNLLEKINHQILKEDALISYKLIKDKLTLEVIKKSISGYELVKTNLDETYKQVASTLISNMFDESTIKNTRSIFELSTPQKNDVYYLINNILTKHNDYYNDIINKYNKLSEISIRLKKLREKLSSIISEELMEKYIKSMHNIDKKILKTENLIAAAKSNIVDRLNILKNKEYHLIRAKNEYTNLLQSNNIKDITTDIVTYLDDLLKQLTEDKLNLIENNFINIFSIIIRKHNYVNSIVIDHNFNQTLYINKSYSINAIINIIKNLGYKEITKKYGLKFLDDLYKHYKTNNTQELENKMLNDSLSTITLSTKVDIHDFSNGEKQIYILCLLWSIVKSADIEIPFIIDTPYARIDNTHRDALSTKYLPFISNQVIILSTNKEIDNSLYNTIKPYISDEYLLLYNTSLRKTEVKKGYFEV